MPSPRSATEKRIAPSPLADRERDRPAVGRVLDRVVDEVDEHLPELAWIGGDGVRAPSARPSSSSTLSGRWVRAASSDAAGELERRRSRSIETGSSSRVEVAGEQQVVDDRGEAVGLGRDHAEQLVLDSVVELEVGAPDRLRGAVDRSERRAQLVRDGRDEVRLQLLERALLGQVPERVDDPLVEADARDAESQSSRPTSSTGTVSVRTGSRQARSRPGSAARLVPLADDVLDRRPTTRRLGEPRDGRRGRVPEPDHALAIDEHDGVADGWRARERPAPAAPPPRRAGRCRSLLPRALAELLRRAPDRFVVGAARTRRT